MRPLMQAIKSSSSLLGSVLVLSLLPACSDSKSDDGGMMAEAGEGGSETGGSSASGSGGAAAGKGGKPSGGSAGKPSGGTSTGGTGVNNGGTPADGWEDVSPAEASGNVGGIVVNRLTGVLLADVSDKGIWRSTNQGAAWERVDGGAVGGVSVMGPAFDVDQDNPVRVTQWSLDGPAAWTPDGGDTWNEMTSVGRNWDFGSTDWATPDPKSMTVTRHEANGEVYATTDGAVTWDLLSITVMASGAGFPPPPFSMVGTMDATTFIYGDGAGILRSTDSGKTFGKVTDLNARTRVPVLFKGVHYLGGDSLMVSTDKGATWEPQGANLEIWVGPFFGENEEQMMVANLQGIYLTSDAGQTWTKAAALPADGMYSPQTFGGFAWDPVNKLLYAAAIQRPLLKLKL